MTDLEKRAVETLEIALSDYVKWRLCIMRIRATL